MPVRADSLKTRPWPNRCLPMLGTFRNAMFARLFRQDLFIFFYRAFVQSMAGENMAMQSAEKNILELQEDLQARFREQRQAGITGEPLDIISGFEALSEQAAA